MRNFSLRMVLLTMLVLGSNALSQVRITPLAGTQLSGKDAYSDSRFLGAAASIEMNQRFLLSLEYQGWNSNHVQHLGSPDRITAFSSRISTTSKKQLFLAGLQYVLFPLSKRTHVRAALNLGYQHLNSERDLFNNSCMYIPPPGDHQEENLLGVSSLSLNYELFRQIHLFSRLRYGYKLVQLDGGGLTGTSHFAQLLLGMNLLVF